MEPINQNTEIGQDAPTDLVNNTAEEPVVVETSVSDSDCPDVVDDVTNNAEIQIAALNKTEHCGEDDNVLKTEHTAEKESEQTSTDVCETAPTATVTDSLADITMPDGENLDTKDKGEMNTTKILTDSQDQNLNITTDDSTSKLDLETEMVNTTTNNAAADQEDSCDKPILETLTFGELQDRIEGKEDDQATICPCLLCDSAYSIWHKEHILAHLVMQHKIVIADVTFIADLPRYLQYWKKRFEDNNWSEFCSTIITNKEYEKTETNGPKEEFFLLCDALPEDKQLRSKLQQKRLEFILTQQQKERDESKFCRQCLFCKQSFCGNRAVLFEHLLTDHSFHMGLPDNLVFTDELFDLIQFKLDNYLCLFCEKKFRDKTALREHMRKKQHRKINPKNKEYDRFYIINYMEVGKNWESLQSEERRLRNSGDEKHSDEEDEWAGWNEDSESKVVCLFCDETHSIQKELQSHMKIKHDFDLRQVTEQLQLNFYQKIKLINYIRRQVYHNRCYGCKKTFPQKSDLLGHLEKESAHLKLIPEITIWDQPQYFFPTYEDDNLLCFLDDNEDEGAAGDTVGVTVIAEDVKISKALFDDADLCKDLKKLKD